MKTNREEILQNALQLFMSMNYEGVSLQMIAHSVGLTKTGIFNYYPSKLDLFIAVADRYLFHLQDPENKFAPSDGSLSSTNTSRVWNIPWPRSCGWAMSSGRRCPESWPMPVTFTSSSRCFFTIPTASASSTNGWKRSISSGATPFGGGQARRTAPRHRHTGSRRSVPAGFYRTGLSNVLLRRPRRRDSPQAIPIYLRAAEALSRLSAAFSTI